MKFSLVLMFDSALLAVVAASTSRKYLPNSSDSSTPTPLLQSNGTKDEFIGYRKGQNNFDRLIESRSKRNAVLNPAHLWPNATIPYIIDGSMGDWMRSRIAIAMEEIMNKSCIKFVPLTDEKDYVKVFRGSGCYSHVGRLFSGLHNISLGYGCEPIGTIIHELLHSIGFYHEQERSDRDNHVDIYWDNIKNSAYSEFHKNSVFNSDNLGQPYDYNSIMHYGEQYFSKDNKPTIKANDPKVVVGALSDSLTELDVKKINILYSCSREHERPACRDDLDQCWYWALNGECKDIGSIMSLRCRLSCKLCESPETVPAVAAAPTTCLDKYSTCIEWADRGICRMSTSSGEEISQACRRACKTCHI